MASLSAILLLVDLATGESAYGSFANWGEVTDSNLAFLEDAVGEVTSKAVTTLDVTLTADEERSLVIKATGALTGNRSILTNDRKGFWFVSNETTGAFTLTFKPTSGTGIVVPRGARWALYCDGTNIYRMGSKAPTVQTFSGSGTWTKPDGCIAAIFEAVGGGAGSGGVKQAGPGNAGSSGGGGSGFYGRTGVLDVSTTASAAVTIGAGGAGGLSASPSAGSSGGNTSITINGTTYTWGGGTGSGGYTANPNGTAGAAGGAAGTGTNVTGGGQHGSMGVKDGTAGAGGATGGDGGSTQLGTGGQGAHTVAVNGAANGAPGANYGAGAGGSVTNNGGSNADGGAGSGGYMRVWEFY